MTTITPPADDYDSPWKDVLEHAFPEFMAFYFPDASAQIDWAQGHEFKNTELRFPVVKLLDHSDRLDSLEADPNPFALVTAAHLRTRQTKHDPQARYQAKRTLVRLLTKRFGPLTDTTSQRLKNATSEQLELWADRIQDAPHIVAIFEAH